MEAIVQIHDAANRFLGFSMDEDDERIRARFVARFECEPAIILITTNIKMAGPIPDSAISTC